jgi:hypothetical protein
MTKHVAWIPVVALLVAASAFAAWSPAPASNDGSTPVAGGMACPGGGHGGCGCAQGGECTCGGDCQCGQGGGCNCGAGCNCGGEGEADCPNFVDENGDTVCDLRGQGNCGCGGGGGQ